MRPAVFLSPEYYYIRGGVVHLKKKANVYQVAEAFRERTVQNFRSRRSNLSIRNGDLYSYGRLVARHFDFGIVGLDWSLTRYQTTRRHVRLAKPVFFADPESLYHSMRHRIGEIRNAIYAFVLHRRYRKTYPWYLYCIHCEIIALQQFVERAGLPGVFETDPVTWGLICLEKYGHRAILGRKLAIADAMELKERLTR